MLPLPTIAGHQAARYFLDLALIQQLQIEGFLFLVKELGTWKK